jgi:hypothetical protein
MKTRSLFIALCLLVFLGAQLAFGWGNATHVYFAKQLGAKFGPFNLNEMYGALLPDCFNFVLTAEGQLLYEQTHDNAMPVWSAAGGPLQKSLAFGFMTHNQSWGADYTAHIRSFTFPSKGNSPKGGGGYAIVKGIELTPQLAGVLKQILLAAGVPEVDANGNPVAEAFAYGIAPALGHDLAETAVDLLVKRHIDPMVGVRMMLAAERRPAGAGELLASAYAGPLAAVTGKPLDEVTAFIVDAEGQFQIYVQQYGYAFSLPEAETIALLSEQTVPIAEMYIEAALAENGLPEIDVTVEAAQVEAFIRAAIEVVEPDYARELSRTLAMIEKELRKHSIQTGYQLFADGAQDESVESSDPIDKPASYALAQNTPNPFNPSTRIGFSLPDQAHVRLTVYNAIGQEVARLVDEERPAGSYIAQWNATNQPSGAYFYRIESGVFVETKRMMLVK